VTAGTAAKRFRAYCRYRRVLDILVRRMPSTRARRDLTLRWVGRAMGLTSMVYSKGCIGFNL